jgi:hypothetical protein
VRGAPGERGATVLQEARELVAPEGDGDRGRRAGAGERDEVGIPVSVDIGRGALATRAEGRLEGGKASERRRPRLGERYAHVEPAIAPGLELDDVRGAVAVDVAERALLREVAAHARGPHRRRPEARSGRQRDPGVVTAVRVEREHIDHAIAVQVAQ